MSLRTLVTVLALASPILAQCAGLGVAFNNYGSGCSGFGQPAPALFGFYSHGDCTITLTLTHTADACPGFCLVNRIVAIGVTPIQAPLGFLPCDLLVEPAFTVSMPPGPSNNFVFNLPQVNLVGLQVYVQGGNIFQTPTGYLYEASNGLHVDYF